MFSRNRNRGLCIATPKRSFLPMASSRTYGIESLESRLLLTIAEPNDTFQTARFDQNNIYGTASYFDTGSVSPSDRNDFIGFYNLFGPSKARIVLNGIAAGADLDLYVHDTNGNVIASKTTGGNATEELTVDLPGNQYFYVRAYAYGGSSDYGLYVYNDYAGNTLATARDIGTSYGQSNSKFQAYGPQDIFNQDYADFADNVDLFKFEMEALGTISLRRTPTGNNLVQTIQLLDADGNVLANGFTDGNGVSINSYTAPAGTYYARLTQTSGSGNYGLRIVSDYAGNTTAAARDLGNLTNTSRHVTEMVSGFGGVSYDDALDLYKFTLDTAATAYVNLDMETTSLYPPPTFDADFFVGRDSNFNGVIDPGEKTYTSTNPGDDALQLALSAGTWYLGVNQDGAYTTYDLDLDVDLDQANNLQPAYKNMSRAIELGTLNGYGTIDGGFGRVNGSSDFTDFYKFTMATGGRLSAFANNNDFYSRTPNDPYITVIRDANNNQTYDAGEEVAIASNSDLKNVSLAAGTYYLRFSNDGQQAAYYGFVTADYAGNTLATARNLGSVGGNKTQTSNDYVEQVFDASSDSNDFYKWTLTTQLAATFTTDGVNGEDLRLTLIKDGNGNGVVDSGDTLATSDISNSPDESIIRVLGAGTYFVRVQGINGSTNYSLKSAFSTDLTDPDNTINEVKNRPGNQKSVGQSFDATMDRLNDVDLVQFTVTAGQRVGFDVDSRNGSSFDSYLRVFNASGTQLAANNNGAAPGEGLASHAYLAYTFPTAGTYYVGVSVNPNTGYSANSGASGTTGSGQTGAYRLSLSNIATSSLPTTLRVQAAGDGYTTTDGRFFAAPSGFTGGTQSTGAYAVAGTDNDPLYYERRYGAFTFSKAVANGTYTLKLYFAENGQQVVGGRKFDVFAEGKQVLNDYDIYKEAGYRTATVKTFTVNVSDQKIDLSFAKVVDNALLSAIELVKI